MELQIVQFNKWSKKEKKRKEKKKKHPICIMEDQMFPDNTSPKVIFQSFYLQATNVDLSI